MTSIPVSAILILAAMALFVVLCLKNVSTILVGILCMLLVSLACPDGVISAIFTTAVNSVTSTIGGMLLPFMLGSLVGEMMMSSGCGTVMGESILKISSRNAAPYMIFVFTILLNMTGMSSTAYIIAAVSIALLKAADLPRHIGLIGLCGGACVTAWVLPGVPGLPGILPTQMYGTTLYAGLPLALGISLLGYLLVGLYMAREIRIARGKGQGYTDAPNLPKFEPLENGKGPSVVIAYAPVVIVVALALVFQYVVELGASNSVVISQAIAALFIMVTCRKYIRGSLIKHVTGAFERVFPPLMAMGFVAGFASVVATTRAYGGLLNVLTTLELNPYVMCVIVTAIIVALTANGLTTMQVMLGNGLPTLFLEAGGNPEILHVLTRVTTTTLDKLPHGVGIILNLSVFGLDYKEGYRYAFISAVIVPIIMTLVGLVVAVLFF